MYQMFMLLSLEDPLVFLAAVSQLTFLTEVVSRLWRAYAISGQIVIGLVCKVLSGTKHFVGRTIRQ